MKAKPIKLINQQWVKVPKEEATHVELCFPLEMNIAVNINPPYTYYPLKKRIIPVQLSGSRSETNNWSWNGNTEKPTLKPSILTEVKYGDTVYRCHSFVNDGVIQFLSDCSHERVNTSIELMDVE